MTCRKNRSDFSALLPPPAQTFQFQEHNQQYDSEVCATAKPRTRHRSSSFKRHHWRMFSFGYPRSLVAVILVILIGTVGASSRGPPTAAAATRQLGGNPTSSIRKFRSWHAWRRLLSRRSSNTSTTSRHYFQLLVRRKLPCSFPLFFGARPANAAAAKMNNNPLQDTGMTAVVEAAANAASSQDESVISRPYNKQHNSQKWPVAIVAAIKAVVSDPARLARISIRAFQYGIIVYLSSALWKALTEVLDEFSQEMNGDDPLFCSGVERERVLTLYDLQTAVAMAAINGSAISPKQQRAIKKTRAPSRGVLLVVQDLLAAGIPLRRTLSGASVESLLETLTRSEVNILQQCLWTPSSQSELHSAWDNVVGLGHVKERLLMSMSMILRHRQHRHKNIQHQHGGDSEKQKPSFSSLLDHSSESQPHHGILLCGPPGCGKTLLVKGLASRCRIPCLVVTPSVLMRKYVGDTNLQVRSLFSLANKMAPCILCIDELDGLFRERHDQEHDASREFKTEFLQWLSGMASRGSATGTTPLAHGDPTGQKNQQQSRRSPIIVVGATNRPFDVDPAILRRLPQAHFVGLPNLDDRYALLLKWLQSVPVSQDFDMSLIAEQTEGYSPSDLRQVFQSAALMGPLREQYYSQPNNRYGNNHENDPRPLATDDVLRALRQVKPTPLSQTYCQSLAPFTEGATQDSSNGQALDDGTWWWETPYGNFYDIGTMEIGHDTDQQIQELSDDPNSDEYLSSDIENDSDDDEDDI